MDGAFFKAENISKTYSDTSKDVLNGINLSFNQGDFVCVLGPSGCGKSTFLRCIAGFEDYEGNITLEGHPIDRKKAECIMVFQDMNQLFPWRTAAGNIRYALKIHGVRDKARREELVQKYLAKVNLSDYGDYYPWQLSGGMKQRIAIARTLSLNPKMILMDEPFASLDAITRNQLQDELLNIMRSELSTVLFITHNIQEAIILSTRIVVMSREGKIIFDKANPLKKPVSPASEGYGALWDELNHLLRVGKDGK